MAPCHTTLDVSTRSNAHLEERDELRVYVTGAAVGGGHVRRRHDDGPHQAAVGVGLLAQHAAVQPQLAAGVLVHAGGSLREEWQGGFRVRVV